MVFLAIFQKSKEKKIRVQDDSGTEPEPGTGTVGTVFPETESGTGTAGTVFQEPKAEPSFSVKLYLTHRKAFFAEEPPEPKTGTARTVPPPSRNRTEPNRGLPDFSKTLRTLSY